MGGRASSKRKSRRDKISSKKKSRRKESKKRRYDSISSSSDDDSLYLEHRSSSTSKADHKRRIAKNKKHRHDSSLSDYSDYRSVSSDSDLSSSDDDDYKIRKARWSRVGSKDIKRKGRKRSISSIGDVDATSGRKRKRLDKDHVIRPIKKSSRKKSKKLLSSSSGSDSKSCSASQSSSSSSEDDKRQMNKVVHDKEKERLRRRRSGKGKQKHKDRSPCTSIGRGVDPSFSVGNSEGELFPVDNSRRLRSVIVVVNQPHNEEENRWEKDPHKEEIVCDQNDYPSPRSLDSNEGGSKMKSDNQSNVAYHDRICIENIADEGVRESEKSRIDDGGCQSEGGYMKCSEEKEIDNSVPVAALGGDDLESILRQKALENLRKFREMPQTYPRSNMVQINNETNVAMLSNKTVDIDQSKSIISDAQEMNEKGGPLLKTEFAEVVKLSDSEHAEKEPRVANLSTTHSRNGPALLECSEEDKSSCSQAVEARAASGGGTSPGAGGTKACSSNVELTSSVEPTSGEYSSGKTKDGSEFEQKTMSVMRGGELVQVSYKVYIPKKAPALVRRHLRR